LNRKAQKKTIVENQRNYAERIEQENFTKKKILLNSKMTLVECRGVKYIMTGPEAQKPPQYIFLNVLDQLYF
jgi:hypothetical protein